LNVIGELPVFLLRPSSLPAGALLITAGRLPHSYSYPQIWTLKSANPGHSESEMVAYIFKYIDIDSSHHQAFFKDRKILV